MSDNGAPTSTGRQPYSAVDNLEIMTGAKNYNAFLIARVLKHAGPAQRIIDFGAGEGYFAAQIKKAGYAVECIEPDHELQGRIRGKGLEVHASLSELADNSVDYFFSLNVLEHVEDDAAILREMKRCLKPGGSIYLYVPAFPILYSSMDRKVGHLRRYRRNSLLKTAQRAALQPHSVSYCDSLGFIASLLYKAGGSDRGDLNPSIIRLYDRIAFPVSRILDVALHRVMGKNLEALLKKC